MEKVSPVKDERGRIIGETRSGLVLDAQTVLPWAVNLDSSAGARVANPFVWDETAQQLYRKYSRIIH